MELRQTQPLGYDQASCVGGQRRPHSSSSDVGERTSNEARRQLHGGRRRRLDGGEEGAVRCGELAATCCSASQPIASQRQTAKPTSQPPTSVKKPALSLRLPDVPDVPDPPNTPDTSAGFAGAPATNATSASTLPKTRRHLFPAATPSVFLLCFHVFHTPLPTLRRPPASAPMFKAQVLRRNFTLFNTVPYSRIARAAARDGHGTVTIQRVVIQKPFWTRSYVCAVSSAQ